VEYIKEQFVAQNENPKKDIYPHVTCATDTKNIEVLFAAVQEVIVKKALMSMPS